MRWQKIPIKAIQNYEFHVLLKTSWVCIPCIFSGHQNDKVVRQRQISCLWPIFVVLSHEYDLMIFIQICEIVPSICFLLAHWVRTTGPMISFHQYDDSDLPNVSPLSGFTELQGCCFEWVLSIQICRKSSFNFVLIVRNGICSPNMFQFIISNVHDIFVRKLEISG